MLCYTLKHCGQKLQKLSQQIPASLLYLEGMWLLGMNWACMFVDNNGENDTSIMKRGDAGPSLLGTLWKKGDIKFPF